VEDSALDVAEPLLWQRRKSAPAIDCGIAPLDREMAPKCARKYARDQPRGSGAFRGQFTGGKPGGFEQASSGTLGTCALAHPNLHAAVEAPPNFPLTPSQR
jgi:hypothetical protein